MPKKNLLIFPDVETAIESVATSFLESILHARQSGAAFNVVLSGGSTPKKLFQYLAEEHQQKPVDWSGVHFYWGDERMVPADDEQSNFGMTNEALLKALPLESSQIHRIRGEVNSAAEIRRLTEDVKSTVPLNGTGMPLFDWIFLGMGDDGHTASLFPGALTLKQQDDIWALATHPQSGQKRITLTLPAINNAKKVVFLVFGENKKTMLNRILYSPLDQQLLPAAMIQPRNGQLDWYVDEMAALESNY